MKSSALCALTCTCNSQSARSQPPDDCSQREKGAPLMDAVSSPDKGPLSKPTHPLSTLLPFIFFVFLIVLGSKCHVAMENQAQVKGLKESGGILEDSKVQSQAKCSFPGTNSNRKMLGCSSHLQVGSHWGEINNGAKGIAQTTLMIGFKKEKTHPKDSLHWMSWKQWSCREPILQKAQHCTGLCAGNTAEGSLRLTKRLLTEE